MKVGVREMEELASSLNNIKGLATIIGMGAFLLVLALCVFAACGKKDRLGPLAMAFVMMEVAAAFLFLTQGIEDNEFMESSPRLMPLLWGIPLLLVSVLQLIRVWRAPSIKAPKHGRLDKVFIVFVVVCAAIMSFKTLGFFVSTGAMLAVLMLVLGERRFLLIAGMSAGWMLFTWLVFNKLLLLGLPVGTLFAR